MAQPKLRIKNSFRYPFEEVRGLDEAQYFLFGLVEDNDLVLVDGQVVTSYDELVKIAGSERYKDKECMEVTLLPAVIGGG